MKEMNALIAMLTRSRHSVEHKSNSSTDHVVTLKLTRPKDSTVTFVFDKAGQLLQVRTHTVAPKKSTKAPTGPFGPGIDQAGQGTH